MTTPDSTEQNVADEKAPDNRGFYIGLAILIVIALAGYFTGRYTLSQAEALLIFLGLLSFLIIAHELGHFSVAKACGMRVERFGFGLPFGPTLWSKKYGETEYCLHACLLGGYVGFADDNPDSDVPEDSPVRFENQPWWNRFAVAIAGVVVNAILGWTIMAFVFLNWGKPANDFDVLIADTLGADSPAATAGILPMDVLVAIEGRDLVSIPMEERLTFVTSSIKGAVGKPLHLTVRRAEKDEPKQLVPITVMPNKEGTIGVQLTGTERIIPADGVVDALGASYTYLAGFVRMNFEAMGKMVTGQVKPTELSGPIMITKMGSAVIEKHGISQGLKLAAIISVILAVMNILPIPALDGGHILFLLIEAVKGSPLNRGIQETITQVGFGALLLLMVFILFNDINNAFIHPIAMP